MSWCDNTNVIDLCSDFDFFFQAEDGIRDVAVTGVQTCALPISSRACKRASRIYRDNTHTRIIMIHAAKSGTCGKPARPTSSDSSRKPLTRINLNSSEKLSRLPQ